MTNKEMNENERKIMLLADTIQGEINRMCVTNDLTELDTMYQHAKINLNKLLDMIYESRFNLKTDCKITDKEKEYLPNDLIIVKEALEKLSKKENKESEEK